MTDKEFLNAFGVDSYEEFERCLEELKGMCDMLEDTIAKKEAELKEKQNREDSEPQALTHEEWDEFDDEPYVCVPLALWQNILIDNLEKIRDGLFIEPGKLADAGEIGALKPLLSGLIGFCNYCEDEHTY